MTYSKEQQAVLSAFTVSDLQIGWVRGLVEVSLTSEAFAEIVCRQLKLRIK